MLTLTPLPGLLAVCRLDPKMPPPQWVYSGPLWALTGTAEELSVVCAWEAVPDVVQREGPWQALMVRGPLDFALTGILSAIAAPLAGAELSIFAVSTFDTDYVLVRAECLEAAVSALRTAGITVD